MHKSRFSDADELWFQDRAWGEHWEEAIGEKLELNPHIPKPDPPKEEEKKEEEEKAEDKKEGEEAAEKKEDDKKEEDDNKKEEDKEKVRLVSF